MKVYITVIDDRGKKHEGSFDLTKSKTISHPEKKELKIKTSDPLEKTIPEKTVENIASNVDTLKIPSLVLIAIKLYGQLTKTQQEKVLKGWGKKVGKDLRGGNYKRDLLTKGLLHEIGKEGKETIYDLTAKGKIEAKKILDNLGDKR